MQQLKKNLCGGRKASSGNGNKLGIVGFLGSRDSAVQMLSGQT